MQKDDDNVARKIHERRKRLTVHVKAKTFDVAKPITTLSFLNDFTLVHNSNGVHDGAAIRLFHLFTKKPASTFLNACTCWKP